MSDTAHSDSRLKSLLDSRFTLLSQWRRSKASTTRPARAARRRRRLLTFIVAISTAFGLALPGASAAQAATTGDIANLALANIGKMACSTNSLGGSYYLSSCTGNGGQPEFWCADFAKWVWLNEGVEDTSTLTPAAASFYTYGKTFGTFSTVPKIGDAVVFSNDGTVSQIHHVALVTQVDSDGTIETASGDWNGQNGTEAQFASTSHVVLNAPAYSSSPGWSPSMGMYLIGYVAPKGAISQSVAVGSGGAVFENGEYHVFGVKASSGVLYQNTWNGAWSGWQNLGGTVTGTPAVTYHDNRLDVFAESPNGAMYQKTWNGTWSDWNSIGGDFS